MTTLEKLIAVEDKLEKMLPEVVERLTPVLLAKGATKRLDTASREMQEKIALMEDSEFKKLWKEASDLNLRLAIEEGRY